MESISFFNPRLSGRRFEDHTIPVELLEDFNVYEELLVKVAKWVYYQKYGKYKVPPGFGDGVSLKLAGISEGSSIANLVLAATTFLAGDLDTRPFFEEARELIVKTIDAAESGSDNIFIPSEYLGYFNKIGKRLRDDEAIDFAPNSNYRAKLNNVNRKRLVMASADTDSVDIETTIRGAISAYDKAERKCTITYAQYSKIDVKINSDYADVFLEAFNDFENNKKVKVSGIGSFNKNDRLVKMQVESVTILHPLDIPMRLEEFLELESGWMNGEGEPFRLESIHWLIDQVSNYFHTDILLPYTFPTVDGGIQFEWKTGNHDMTAYINLNDKSGYVHYLNLSNDSDYDLELDFASDEGWQKLVNELAKYFKN